VPHVVQQAEPKAAAMHVSHASVVGPGQCAAGELAARAGGARWCWSVLEAPAWVAAWREKAGEVQGPYICWIEAGPLSSTVGGGWGVPAFGRCPYSPRWSRNQGPRPHRVVCRLAPLQGKGASCRHLRAVSVAGGLATAAAQPACVQVCVVMAGVLFLPCHACPVACASLWFCSWPHLL
jgi:hypothetical protein